MISVVSLVSIFSTGALGLQAPSTANEWKVTVQNQEIVVKPGSAEPIRLKPGLHDVKFIEWLRGPTGSRSHLLLRAKTCADCLDDPQLVILSLESSNFEAFTYPGKIKNPRRRRVDYVGRAFYGKCLPGKKGDQLVYFQEDKIDRWKYRQKSVLVAEVTGDGVKHKLHTSRRRKPKLKTVKRRVKRKSCFELRGWERKILPRGSRLSS